MGAVCNVGWSAMYERRMTDISDEVVMRDFGQAQDTALRLSFNRSHSSTPCLLMSGTGILVSGRPNNLSVYFH